MQYRPATASDVPAIADTLALAFSTDPVWGVALTAIDGGAEHHRPFWSLWVRGALTYSTVYMTEDAGAVATWIPPGGVELPDGLEEQMFALVAAAVSPTAFSALLELWERFDGAHPHDEPHWYLSLLATHPSQRGKGVGQQLLAATLGTIELPAYLESTNPANNHRYERAGFRVHGGFDSPFDGAHVTTMWRDAHTN